MTYTGHRIFITRNFITVFVACDARLLLVDNKKDGVLLTVDTSQEE